MTKNRFRLLAVCSHTVQYMAPNFAVCRNDEKSNCMSLIARSAVLNPHMNPEFDTTVQWDVPLIDGYAWVEVPNRGFGVMDFGVSTTLGSGS